MPQNDVPSLAPGGICLIGYGAMARALTEAHARLPGMPPITAVLLRPDSRTETPPGLVRSSDVRDLIALRPGLVVECAGQQALRDYAPALLEAGITVLAASVGALADEALHQRVMQAGERGRSRLIAASGAIGALDALAAARLAGLERVLYTGTKPPRAWKGTPAEQRADLDALAAPTVVFEGSAREAALRFPQNANVTAAVALAGVGFDETRVRLIADPEASGNLHSLDARGAFGSFQFDIANTPLPGNPRTSWLAALSLAHHLRRTLGAAVETS